MWSLKRIDQTFCRPQKVKVKETLDQESCEISEEEMNWISKSLNWNE